MLVYSSNGCLVEGAVNMYSVVRSIIIMMNFHGCLEKHVHALVGMRDVTHWNQRVRLSEMIEA